MSWLDLFKAGQKKPTQPESRGNATAGSSLRASAKGYSRFTRLVFIDYEGVLRPTGQTKLTQLPILIDWLEAQPEIGLVLTTQMRATHSLRALLALMGSAKDRVVGATPVFSAVKQVEVEMWLINHRYRGLWAVVTADKQCYPKQCPLVVAEPDIGLTLDHLGSLEAWLELNGKHSGP